MGDLFPQVLDLGVMITDEDWQQLKTQEKEPLHFLFQTSVTSVAKEFSWWRSGTRSNTNDAVQARKLSTTNVTSKLEKIWKASRLSVWIICVSMGVAESWRLSGAGVRPKKSVGDMIGWELKAVCTERFHGRWETSQGQKASNFTIGPFVIATSLHIIYICIYRRFDIWLMNH